MAGRSLSGDWGIWGGGGAIFTGELVLGPGSPLAIGRVAAPQEGCGPAPRRLTCPHGLPSCMSFINPEKAGRGELDADEAVLASRLLRRADVEILPTRPADGRLADSVLSMRKAVSLQRRFP